MPIFINYDIYRDKVIRTERYSATLGLTVVPQSQTLEPTMPDFTKYLSQSVGEALPPAVLPIAVYPGIVKSHEFGESSQKHTPFIRYHHVITGWPDDVPETDRYRPDGKGGQIEIDLSKQRFHSDFYLTEESKFMLHQFWKSCGLQPGISEQEAVAMVVGSPVRLPITQQLNQDTNRTYNPRRVDRATGTAELDC